MQYSPGATMFERRLATADLCIFFPLALPGIGTWILDVLVAFNHKLGMPGTMALGVAPALLTNLMGMFAVSFALVRLQSPPGAWRRHTMLVKAAAVLLIVWSVVRGMPLLLLAIAIADAVAAVTLFLGGDIPDFGLGHGVEKSSNVCPGREARPRVAAQKKGGEL